jgi:hypothetical protein
MPEPAGQVGISPFLMRKQIWGFIRGFPGFGWNLDGNSGISLAFLSG